MTWKTVVLAVVLLGLYGFACFEWGKQQEREWWTDTDIRDTVFVPQAFLVHDTLTVKPNPVQAVVKPDPRLKARLDSLMAVSATKDAVIEDLAQTRYAEQRFSSSDPTGVQVSGLLCLEYDPIDKQFFTVPILDTVRVRQQIVTVTQTIVEERIEWGWVVGGTAVGLVAGAILIHELEKRDDSP